VKLRAIRSETCAQRERRPKDAWTLIEAIGVIAVIALLVAAIMPTIAEIIQRSKVNSTISSYQSLKTATVNHVKQYLALNSLFGTNSEPVPIVDYIDTILMPEGFLDRGFHPPIGGPNAVVQLVTGTNSNNGQGYWFLGLGKNTGSACSLNFGYVVECVMTNVTYLDAGSACLILDQAQLVPALDGYLDTAGKMDYSTNNGGTLRMYVVGR
jgi:type II secretory pathway pseudopilin PulG